MYMVALYMSAWIEICCQPNQQHLSLSHSTWVRGLKFYDEKMIIIIESCRTLHECVDWNKTTVSNTYSSKVALYMSAWIEIDSTVTTTGSTGSHSTWVRGLKFGVSTIKSEISSSHSTWVRGLKFGQLLHPLRFQVALYMSAWIEIRHSCVRMPKIFRSHSTWVRGLK